MSIQCAPPLTPLLVFIIRFPGLPRRCDVDETDATPDLLALVDTAIMDTETRFCLSRDHPGRAPISPPTCVVTFYFGGGSAEYAASILVSLAERCHCTGGIYFCDKCRLAIANPNDEEVRVQMEMYEEWRALHPFARFRAVAFCAGRYVRERGAVHGSYSQCQCGRCTPSDGLPSDPADLLIDI